MGIGKYMPGPLKNALKKYLYLDTRSVYEFPAKTADRQFRGKTAIVTGGAGGIGSAIAYRLAAEGAHVFVLGRTKAALDQVVAEIRAMDGSAEAYAVDVCDYAALGKCRDFIDGHDKAKGELFLVTCAGGGARSRAKVFSEQDISVIDDVICTNLMGTVNCCHVFAPRLLASGGSVVNISSVIGIGGKEKYCDYAAAKAGIIGFTRSLAIEFSPHGVRCNVVSPGKIQRGIMSGAQIDDEISRNYVGYGGKPQDVAGTVSFLLSDDARFITGQNVCVDGGRTLGLHGD